MKQIIFVIFLAASSVAMAFGQYAFWTGRSERATTMSYQSGYNCEYRLSDGRTFWRFFSYSCPQQVQVD